MFPPARAPAGGRENPLAARRAGGAGPFADRDDAFANFAAKPPLDVLAPDALRAYVDHGLRTGPTATASSWRARPRTRPACTRAAWRHDTFARLGEVAARWRSPPGGDERHRPGAVGPRRSSPALPDGRLGVMPTSRHFGPMEDPAAMAAAAGTAAPPGLTGRHPPDLSHPGRTLGSMASRCRRRSSPSKVSSFTDCALAFRFSAIDRLPEPPAVAATQGTLVHAALERLFCLEPAERTLDAALACLDAAVGRPARPTPSTPALELDDEAEAAFLAEAERLVRSYFGLEDPTTVHPIGLELRLEAEVDDLRLRGIIDRLELDADGELVVTDYKTGAAPVEPDEQQAPGGRRTSTRCCASSCSGAARARSSCCTCEPGGHHHHAHRRIDPRHPRAPRRRVAGGRAGLRARRLPARSPRGCAPTAPSRPTAPPSAATRRGPPPGRAARGRARRRARAGRRGRGPARRQ